jgi:tRNA threonylcarbamoyladenosine biosynthesis protein TsaB
MILAIDTATKLLSIALHDGDTLIAEQTWIAGNRHTTTLAPTIQAMLAANETSIKDLSAVAVSTGPGSYTGLRIGVSFAKGLASAHGLPLIGMTTLDLIAKGQPSYGGNAGLVAVVQAGRGRVIVQTYHWHKNAWQTRTEPRLMNWETLISTLDGIAVITGEVDKDGRAALENVEQATIAPAAWRLRRTGFLAEYAWEQLRANGDDAESRAKTFDPINVLPIYLQTD